MTSINLLPTEIKEEYIKSKQNKKLVNILLFILSIVGVFVTILFFSRAYLIKKQDEISRETTLKEQSLKRFGTLEDDAKKLDSRIDAARKIIQTKTYYTKALNRIWASTPDNIFLNEVTMEKDQTKRGKITGSAKDKSAMASFMDSLEKSDEIDFVDLESTSLAIDSFTNIEVESFVLTFSINEKYIK